MQQQQQQDERHMTLWQRLCQHVPSLTRYRTPVELDSRVGGACELRFTGESALLRVFIQLTARTGPDEAIPCTYTLTVNHRLLAEREGNLIDLVFLASLHDILERHFHQ